MRIRLVAGTMMIEAMLHILRVIFPCSRTPCGKNTSTCIPNARAWGGGGGVLRPLYKLYRYVYPQRVLFFSRFGHKKGIDFSWFRPFWS